MLSNLSTKILFPTDGAKLIKCKFVNRSDHIQMELDNPQDGHRCDACHNAFDAKVNTRKFLDYKSNVMK